MTSSGPPGRGPVAQPAVRLLLLGSFAVEIDAVAAAVPRTASRKARTLLKLLAVERGHLVPTDRAIEVLWPEGPPSRPVENIATLVSRLRSWLGPRAVVGGHDGYTLGSEVGVDVDVAESLTQRAEQELGAGHTGLALVPAEQACLLLGQGRALEDEPYADWAEPARRAQVALLRRARLAYAGAALAAGEPLQAVATATSGVADDPLDERDGPPSHAGSPGCRRAGPGARGVRPARDGCSRRSRVPTRHPRPKPYMPRCCATSRTSGRPRMTVPVRSAVTAIISLAPEVL